MKYVLIVDDSRTIRSLIRKMIARCGFEIGEAADGAEALALCLARMPDGIITDWNMPVMDGITFVRALRAAPGGTEPRVIFCTTENSIEYMQDAISAGADEFIMKPFDADLVVSRLVQVGLFESDEAA